MNQASYLPVLQPAGKIVTTSTYSTLISISGPILKLYLKRVNDTSNILQQTTTTNTGRVAANPFGHHWLIEKKIG